MRAHAHDRRRAGGGRRGAVASALGLLVAVAAGAGGLSITASAQDADPGAAAPAATITGTNPVEVRQDAEDRSGLDLVRVQLGRAADGRLRAVLTLAEDFSASDLRARRDGQVPGSLCLRMWTLTPSYGTPPDRLLCVSAPAKGSRLVASLHQEQVNADLRRISILSPTRPSSRSVVVRFSQSAMGRPKQIRFAAEATTRACTRPACVDVLPAAPKVATLKLQSP